tara:strand:+ start:241 stop:684 length:444 start_codon:yes stop_codon:yes gene_type:complete
MKNLLSDTVLSKGTVYTLHLLSMIDLADMCARILVSPLALTLEVIAVKLSEVPSDDKTTSTCPLPDSACLKNTAGDAPSSDCIVEAVMTVNKQVKRPSNQEMGLRLICLYVSRLRSYGRNVVQQEEEDGSVFTLSVVVSVVEAILFV